MFQFIWLCYSLVYIFIDTYMSATYVCFIYNCYYINMINTHRYYQTSSWCLYMCFDALSCCLVWLLKKYVLMNSMTTDLFILLVTYSHHTCNIKRMHFYWLSIQCLSGLIAVILFSFRVCI